MPFWGAALYSEIYWEQKRRVVVTRVGGVVILALLHARDTPAAILPPIAPIPPSVLVLWRGSSTPVG